MTKARMGTVLLTGCLLLAGGAAPAGAAPDVAQMLTFRPSQDGVVCSTPTPQEEALCKVEPVSSGRVGAGWLLRDPKGLMLRRFYDSHYDGKSKTKIDMWSYYKDGVEVYREWATTNGERADNFRWTNAGGMKWGVDENKDGKIDTWKMISPEEVGQEIVAAVAKRDFTRLRALMLGEPEIKSMGLPTAEANRIREMQKQAPAKFQDAVAKLTNLNDKTRWLHLETSAPQCLPAEQTGMKYDLVRYTNGTILCETAGQSDWLQSGEMIQVGLAWRIIDAPSPGLPKPADMGDGKPVTDKELQAMLEELNAHDKQVPSPQDQAAMLRYHLKRADLLEKIQAKVSTEERDLWIRQLADCLSAAVQNSKKDDKAAYQRLTRLEEQIAKALPGGNLAGYITYRLMSADYALKLSEPDPKFDKIQQDWLERLAKFVKDYPKADDAPAALEQLGMVSEMMSKENEAKNWYQMLVQNHADKPQAAKGQGALRRLNLEGKVMELTGPTLGTNAPFDIARLRGKVVVVYYWASWNKDSAADFARMKQLLTTHGSKGLDLVSVNLDNTAEEATKFLRDNPAPGVHLFQANGQASGLESPLAVQYGIMVLPNLFLVDKDGKVASRIVQVSNLEEEVKKLLSK